MEVDASLSFAKESSDVFFFFFAEAAAAAVNGFSKVGLSLTFSFISLVMEYLLSMKN